MKFDLYSMTDAALILPILTGVVYEQQTAGGCCNQRSQEGALVIIPSYFVTKEVHELADGDYEITVDGAARINNSWLEFDGYIKIELYGDKLRDSEEAWLYVNVVMDNYVGPAILTWENSD